MKKYLLIFLIFITQMVFAQQDCITAIPICSDSEISLKPNGSGSVKEGSGCLSSESNSIWFTFSIQTAGTLTFLITPMGPKAYDIDYDFALYGPNHSCSNIKETPLRCSYAGMGNLISRPLTGLSMTATETTEGAGGIGFVKYIDVLPGEVYHLLLNNYSTEIAPFKLSFGGTATLLTPFDNNSLKIYQPFPFLKPGANNDGDIDICGNPVTFDFATLSNHIRNNNPNFVIKYYRSAADAASDYDPITTPIPVNTTTQYAYSISYVDPTKPLSFLNQCREFGSIKFVDRSFTLTPGELTSCSNNNSGTALYDLSSADIGLTPNLNVKYYPSMYDLDHGINEITNPYQYVSAEGSAFVKATNQFGCITITEIKLKFHPLVKALPDPTLVECHLETNPSMGMFNLDNAPITVPADGTKKKYYPSLADAVDATNEITNYKTYMAPNGVVYVRVYDDLGCFTVAKITLQVLPPVKSSVLQDKIICMEDKTTLDAGPGFKKYEWSTGATTQSISNVGVGTYWVKLTTRIGECTTTQKVTVYPSEQPVISSVDVSTTNITVNVTGGTPDYKYSIDNVVWQDSNVFTNVARGNYKIYVKDAYDCDPIVIEVIVPNIVNVITPNGDGINDVLDYSAIAGKQNLTLNIFDRYGVKIHQADKSNGYKWDGTIAGKKIPTGTYWYSLTWNENNSKNTPFKFSGWIIVKNRE
ncbi:MULTISPECIES: T9SS type B sorting domain-containing protein [Chryseobacterium]|uniref:Gliding motility-associated C-terminal domain-containing protein n=1 Tax=Chryseobacterium bernardetii TaxID=1241978 RepID=A0A3G6TCL3_9FLAO|nr:MULTISPECIES: T9SS type B sorting domain-containing protein [Chryseobacterium]AZB24386.1 gliding motility-associated C-terminal domain-containing protein [Chryseobacterium bernardetii]AZB34970.1 gliding motility-associated C-terminal domain-containing protein [Chryseobacterium bernardetii]UCA58806.1 T9SS type B sorting domain-containing protein [Chryseobacterium rhizoplanae]